MQGLEADSATIGQSPRRFEVITGETGRRSHDDVFKGRLVALTLAPGSCIADIARAHDVHPQLLYTWRRQAKAGKLVLPASDAPEFVSLMIDDAAPTTPSHSSISGNETATIATEVGGVTVHLADAIDANRIAGIATALRDAQ